MTYTLQRIQEQQIWDDFVQENFSFYSFLSSWTWGDFNAQEGHTVTRYGIYNDTQLVGVMLLIRLEAKRGTFRVVPHSPLIVGDYFAILGAILPQLEQEAKNQGVSFMRINGLTEKTIEHARTYKELGFRIAPLHMHAEESNLLDLRPDEEALLQNVKKNTRYMINRAEREGVIVEIDNSIETIQMFVEMHHAHARRTNGKLQYTPFSGQYIQRLFDLFGDQVNLFKATYQGVVEAACVTIQYGDMAAYYLGVSDIKHPKFSPSYLCQREAILHAKRTGATKYNFRGVSPDDNKSHPLHGVSFFKRGFGGEDYFLTHAQDYIFNQKYWMTRAIDSWRKWKRGYYYVKPTK